MVVVRAFRPPRLLSLRGPGPHHRFRWIAFALAAGALVRGTPGSAQVVDTDSWVANNEVHAVVRLTAGESTLAAKMLVLD